MNRLPSKWASVAAIGLLVVLLWLCPAVTRGQIYPGWPEGFVPPPGLGPTPGADLRNAVRAVRNQVNIARNAARYWGRRANSAGYRAQYALQDFQSTLYQFQVLRGQFKWLASIAEQQNRPQAANAVAELGAGLSIIAEIFDPVQTQLNAGAYDRDAIVRLCRALDEALDEWDKELTKNSARLNLVW